MSKTLRVRVPKFSKKIEECKRYKPVRELVIDII